MIRSTLVAASLATLAAAGPAAAQGWGAGRIPWGLYRSTHSVTIEGQRVRIDGYVYIDRDGLMTAYALRSHGTGRADCLVVASGKAADSALVGRLLGPGKAPNGEPAYRTTLGDLTFGVLTRRSATGNVEWFVRTAKTNNTVTVTGSNDSVTADGSTFAITGQPLETPTLSDLRDRMCAD